MVTLREWPDEIHLIGAGGIGTHVLLALIELGAKTIHVWDDDLVERHNRPSQFVYTPDDVGSPKVQGMQRFVERQGYSTTVIPHQVRVDATTSLNGIVVSGVDSMASRKEIWKAILGSRGFVPVYIDGRIEDEHVHLMNVDPLDPIQVKQYEKTLFDDGSASALSCTTNENPHSPLRVAEKVSMNLTLFLRGEPVKLAVYSNLRLEALNR